MGANILWFNTATNGTQLWLMDGPNVAGRATVIGDTGAVFVGPPWSIVETGDFNRDGNDDFLWHNTETNETQIWFMAGTRVTGRATVLGETGQVAYIGPPWGIVGVGDFNNDGRADILWHNSATNEIQIWFMADHRVTSRGTVLGENGSPAFVGPPWVIVGTGDFNRDGKTDILWHNTQTNETQIWFMDAYRVIGRATVVGPDGHPTFIGPPFSIVATGDFNADGKTDIVWHHSQTNETQIWFMDGYRVSGRGTVVGPDGRPTFIGPPWGIIGATSTIPDRVLLPTSSDTCFENANNQKNWRFCVKCRGLAFDGYSDKGRCPAGGAHQIAGYMFVLAHSLADSATSQAGWRFCTKCMLMFFNGYAEKGVCAAGGGHQAAGFEFVLPHDLPATGVDQDSWRFCTKCSAIFFDGDADKGSCPREGGHAALGYPFVLPHDIHEPFVFTAPMESGGLAAFGGSVTLTVNLDGTARWQGHAHDSGSDNYDFGVSAVVTAPSGKKIAAARSGHVSGTFSSGSRNEDWDGTVTLPTATVARLADFSRARLDTSLQYDSSIGDTFETIAGWALKWGVGDALGPLGAVVFLGLEIGSLADSGSLVPGARLASGILWMAGPSNMIFAVAAEGIASLGDDSREITSEEYDWANERVFKGALPPRDRLRLTNTIGAQDRAFTFPRSDGKITLNMGRSAFDDPRKYHGESDDNPKKKTYGRTFIHELVHACQIHHSSAELSLMADALSSKLCELTGDNPYDYGFAPLDYTDLNLEQQAQIVGDWFVGFPKSGREAFTNHTNIAMDEESPYFPYIAENVRVGNF